MKTLLIATIISSLFPRVTVTYSPMHAEVFMEFSDIEDDTVNVTLWSHDDGILISDPLFPGEDFALGLTLPQETGDNDTIYIAVNDSIIFKSAIKDISQ